MSNEELHHNQNIVHQFTQQAQPFTHKMKAHSKQEMFDLMFKLSEVNSSDLVLDVACGSGLVACAFAPKVKEVTGIDLTPAMIEEAKKLQHEKNLKNMSWQIGDVTHLPFDDQSFSLVVTRFTFHHFLNPKENLKEMFRVCMPGGRVMVVDVALTRPKVDGFNFIEKLRDPSHVRALTEQELMAMISSSGLQALKASSYSLEVSLEDQLKASFPNPGDEQKIRELLTRDVGVDQYGLGAHVKDGQITLVYPIMIVVGYS